MARRFYIYTMGCQMNEYDSDYLGQSLVHAGYQPAEDPGDADLIMINTCTVRAKAEQKAFSRLGRVCAQKEKNPRLILGIMGCLAQQQGTALFKRFPQLDLVIGTRELGRFRALLNDFQENGQPVVAVDLDREPFAIPTNGAYFQDRVKGYITIMQGCENFCSYCVVPYVRGREVSRTASSILKEAGWLVSRGTKEITLLGQNVNSYHSPEKDGGESFSDLLRSLDSLRGLVRVRFTTSHPKDLSDDLAQCFGTLDHLCPHIHLPFQAGSNRILKRMNRGYTREKYLQRIDQLRFIRPDIAISSDVMVGFPGEKEQDFRMTLDLIKTVEFDNLYSFKYSDRRYTRAEGMDHKVGEQEKSARLEELQALQREIGLKKNRRLIGGTEEVLVEGPSKIGDQWTGRTAANKIVNFNSNHNIIGKLVKVKIKDISVNSLKGVALP